MDRQTGPERIHVDRLSSIQQLDVTILKFQCRGLLYATNNNSEKMLFENMKSLIREQKIMRHRFSYNPSQGFL